MEPFFVKETREGFNSKRLVFINSLKLLRCGLGEGAFEGYTLCQSPPSLKQNRIVFWCEGAAVHLLEGNSMHKFLLAHISPFKTQDWRESLLLGNKLRWASVSFCPILVGRWCKERKEKEVYCLWWRGSCEYFYYCCSYYFLMHPVRESHHWLAFKNKTQTHLQSFTDTHLKWTPHYYRQFALSLGRESLYIFSKFNPLNTDTSLIGTLFMAPLDFSKVFRQNFFARSAASKPKKAHFARQTREVALYQVYGPFCVCIYDVWL